MNICVKNIHKTFLEKLVIDNLSYEFNKHKNYRIIGANGSGKTTLFHLMIGTLNPCMGEIQYDGKPSHMCKFGWVSSTELGLFSRLTGRENIHAIARLLGGYTTKSIDDMMSKWMDIDSFRSSLDTKFFKSSSGMKQILKIFCALLHKPQTLIMDEPFRNLDAQTRQTVSLLLCEIDFIDSIIFSDHFYNENIIPDSITLRLEKGKLIDLT